MGAYESAEWFEFGVGTVGAAAALSGLLFVAMSINIARIIAVPRLPDRAASNLVLFVHPLVVGTWILVPGQGRTLLGTELLVTALVAGALMVWLGRPANRVGAETRRSWLLGSSIPSIVIPGLTLVGGATVVAGHGGGLYWVAPAVVLAFVTGLVGAWVLLVEVLR